MSVGNEMSNADIVALNAAINLQTLMAYRLAVGKRTRVVVKRLRLDDLLKRPKLDRQQRLVTEGAVEPSTTWLLDYWGGHPAANLLLMPATRHSFVHLDEIKRLLPRLRRIRPEPVQGVYWW